MATTSESQTTVQAGVLTPVLSTRYALRAEHAGVCLLLVLVFVMLSYITLPTGILWTHVAAGDWILAQGQLPAPSLAMPLAEGVPGLDTAWLSQVLLAATYQAGGSAALSALFTLVTFGSLLMLGGVFYLQTGRKRFMLGGLLITLFLGWGLISQLRPETFGFFCLAALLALLVRATAWQSLDRQENTQAAADPFPNSVPKSVWIGAPLIAILWTNLDSSFVVAMVVLFAWAVGAFCDVAIRRNVSSALQSSGCRQRIYLFELALLATLINPHGIDTWLNALGLAQDRLGSNLAMASVPLTMASLPGFALAAVCLLAAVLLRLSPRQVSVAEAFVFVLGVGASAYAARWLPWFAPLAAIMLLPHLAAACSLGRPARVEVEPPGMADEAVPAKQFQFAFTLVSLLLVWIGFAMSSLATPVLGGKPRTLAAMHNSQTPLGVAAWLNQREAAPRLVFTHQDWADYLAYQGGVPVFAGSAFELLPAQARVSYLQLAAGDNWERIADRYAVDLLVIDKVRQPGLLAAARRVESGWRSAFEDPQALVLERVVKAAPRQPSTEPTAPEQPSPLEAAPTEPPQADPAASATFSLLPSRRNA